MLHSRLALARQRAALRGSKPNLEEVLAFAIANTSEM